MLSQDLPTDSQTVKELELDRLTLSNGTETTVLNTFSVKFNSIFGELETLLNKCGQFTDTTTLFTKHLLSVGGTNDDSGELILVSPLLSTSFNSFFHLLGTGRSHTDFNTSVTFFSKFTSEEFVEFSVEDTVSDLVVCVVCIV